MNVEEPLNTSTETANCADSERKDLQETAKRCFDRVIEVTKARLTIHLFLALATLTLTGYAFQNTRFEIFYLAAVAPLFGLFVDFQLKFSLIAPFLYKAFVSDYRLTGQESEIAYFLQFGREERSPYIAALKLPSEGHRQRKFRSLYIKRNMPVAVLVFTAASTAELLLGVFWR